MIYKVDRAVLKKVLRDELATLEAEHEKAMKAFVAATEAFPDKILAEIDRFRAQVVRGKVPTTDYGDVKCGLSKAPRKPDPDCRMFEIKECLRVLSLSNDPEFRLNDDSKFFRYACEVRRPQVQAGRRR